MDQQPTPAHKAGFVSILGNPNVGKSTLMNALTGERLSIATAKAQTTRHRIMGIVNGEDYQIVYSDTPGVLRPAYKMQEYMMRYVESALQDSDILLYMVEVRERNALEGLLGKIKKMSLPVILVINKTDTATAEEVAAARTYWEPQLEPEAVFCISALKQWELESLKAKIVEFLPVCPPYFPKDELTDRPMRFFVSEIIREKILLQYKKEVPYSVQIEVLSYEEGDTVTHIEAMIYVERDSQKGILLGHRGEAIKKLGMAAREDIEAFIGQKIYLGLSVKVQKDWRNDDRRLQVFGYGN